MSGRRNVWVASVVAAATVGLAAPSAVSAGLAGDLLDDVRGTVNGLAGGGNGGNGGGGGGGAPAPSILAPPEPAPAPPASGPSAEGTAATVDAEPVGEDEDVVVGRSRAEQDEDEYQGEVTIISLFGHSVPLLDPTQTEQGESDDGPFGQLNAGLDELCASSDDSLCLSVLDVDSRTEGNGSWNSFTGVGADLRFGDSELSADVLTSEGNISEDGSCQESSASSEVAGASAASPGAGEGAVSAFSSSSGSRACDDGSEEQTNDSEVVNVPGESVPTPAPGCDGLPAEAPEGTDPDQVVSAECNSTSTDGGSGGSSESLTATAAPDEDDGLAEGNAARSKSGAEAPGKGTDDDGDDPSGDGNDPSGDGQGVLGETGSGGDLGNAGGPSADSDRADAAGADAAGALPFTGAELGQMTLIGLGVMALGLGAMALADRRRRSLGR